MYLTKSQTSYDDRETRLWHRDSPRPSEPNEVLALHHGDVLTFLREGIQHTNRSSVRDLFSDRQWEDPRHMPTPTRYPDSLVLFEDECHHFRSYYYPGLDMLAALGGFLRKPVEALEYNIVDYIHDADVQGASCSSIIVARENPASAAAAFDASDAEDVARPALRPPAGVFVLCDARQCGRPFSLLGPVTSDNLAVVLQRHLQFPDNFAHRVCFKWVDTDEHPGASQTFRALCVCAQPEFATQWSIVIDRLRRPRYRGLRFI